MYSAGVQRRLAVDGSLTAILTAPLRFDQLFARTVVIPDTHFLHGVFFMGVDPAQLARDVGRGQQDRHLALEIKARPAWRDVPPRGTLLAGALAMLLFRGPDHLNGFPFNSVADPTDRMNLALAIESTPAIALTGRLANRESVAVATALASFLRELAPSPAAANEIDRLEFGWSAWIRAEQYGLLDVKPYEGAFDISGELKDHTRSRIRSAN